MNWTCNSKGYNVLVNYICIYVLVRFEFSNLNFFVGKWTAGAVLELTTPTNGNYRSDWCYKPPLKNIFVEAAGVTRCSYQLVCRGGL